MFHLQYRSHIAAGKRTSPKPLGNSGVRQVGNITNFNQTNRASQKVWRLVPRFLMFLQKLLSGLQMEFLLWEHLLTKLTNVTKKIPNFFYSNPCGKSRCWRFSNWSTFGKRWKMLVYIPVIWRIIVRFFSEDQTVKNFLDDMKAEDPSISSIHLLTEKGSRVAQSTKFSQIFPSNLQLSVNGKVYKVLAPQGPYF